MGLKDIFELFDNYILKYSSKHCQNVLLLKPNITNSIKMESFQSLFFQYELPDPLKSVYQKEYAKSNDLRLLIQIATRSFLRMHTDPKTNNIHFTCKQKGSECFDLIIYWCQDRQVYYFIEDPRKMNHSGPCQQKGALFKFLEIYNLMKLKKNEIQQIMIQYDLMNQSPSAILSKLSGERECYFFEPMINGQTELKRKLRKRFDNVINIDIKKIGKVQQKKQQQCEMEYQKIIPVVKPEKSKLKVQSCVVQKTKKLQIQQEEQMSPKCKSKKNKIKKNPKQHLQKLRDTIKKQSENAQNQSSEDMRQYILLLGQGNQVNLETVLVNNQQNSSLAQLNLLNQHADYQWDSSSGEEQDQLIKQQQKEPFEVIEVNRQDYFKSLRNSTLKKSLEKESLYNFIFAKQNYNS